MMSKQYISFDHGLTKKHLKNFKTHLLDGMSMRFLNFYCVQLKNAEISHSDTTQICFTN